MNNTKFARSPLIALARTIAQTADRTVNDGNQDLAYPTLSVDYSYLFRDEGGELDLKGRYQWLDIYKTGAGTIKHSSNGLLGWSPSNIWINHTGSSGHIILSSHAQQFDLNINSLADQAHTRRSITINRAASVQTNASVKTNNAQAEVTVNDTMGQGNLIAESMNSFAIVDVDKIVLPQGALDARVAQLEAITHGRNADATVNLHSARSGLLGFLTLKASSDYRHAAVNVRDADVSSLHVDVTAAQIALADIDSNMIAANVDVNGGDQGIVKLKGLEGKSSINVTGGNLASFTANGIAGESKVSLVSTRGNASFTSTGAILGTSEVTVRALQGKATVSATEWATTGLISIAAKDVDAEFREIGVQSRFQLSASRSLRSIVYSTAVNTQVTASAKRAAAEDPAASIHMELSLYGAGASAHVDADSGLVLGSLKGLDTLLTVRGGSVATQMEIWAAKAKYQNYTVNGRSTMRLYAGSAVVEDIAPALVNGLATEGVSLYQMTTLGGNTIRRSRNGDRRFEMLSVTLNQIDDEGAGKVTVNAGGGSNSYTGRKLDGNVDIFMAGGLNKVNLQGSGAALNVNLLGGKNTLTLDGAYTQSYNVAMFAGANIATVHAGHSSVQGNLTLTGGYNKLTIKQAGTAQQRFRVDAYGGMNTIEHKKLLTGNPLNDITSDLDVTAGGASNKVTKFTNGLLTARLFGGNNKVDRKGHGDTWLAMLGASNTVKVEASSPRPEDGESDRPPAKFGAVLFGAVNTVDYRVDGMGEATVVSIGGRNRIDVNGMDASTVAVLAGGYNQLKVQSGSSVASLMMGGGNYLHTKGGGTVTAVMSGLGNVVVHDGRYAGPSNSNLAMFGGLNAAVKLGDGNLRALQIAAGANVVAHIGNGTTSALMLGVPVAEVSANVLTKVGGGSNNLFMGGSFNVATIVNKVDPQASDRTLAAMVGTAGLSPISFNVLTQVGGSDLVAVMVNANGNAITHITDGNTGFTSDTTAFVGLNTSANFITKVGDGNLTAIAQSQFANTFTHVGDGDLMFAGYAGSGANVVLKQGDGDALLLQKSQGNLTYLNGDGDTYSVAQGRANALLKVGDGGLTSVASGDVNLTARLGQGNNNLLLHGDYNAAFVDQVTGQDAATAASGTTLALMKGEANLFAMRSGGGATVIGQMGDNNLAIVTSDALPGGTPSADGAVQDPVLPPQTRTMLMQQGKHNFGVNDTDGLSVSAQLSGKAVDSVNVAVRVGDGTDIALQGGNTNVHVRVGDGLSMGAAVGNNNLNVQVGNGTFINAALGRRNISIAVGNGSFNNILLEKQTGAEFKQMAVGLVKNIAQTWVTVEAANLIGWALYGVSDNNIAVINGQGHLFKKTQEAGGEHPMSAEGTFEDLETGPQPALPPGAALPDPAAPVGQVTDPGAVALPGEPVEPPKPTPPNPSQNQGTQAAAVAGASALSDPPGGALQGTLEGLRNGANAIADAADALGNSVDQTLADAASSIDSGLDAARDQVFAAGALAVDSLALALSQGLITLDFLSKEIIPVAEGATRSSTSGFVSDFASLTADQVKLYMDAYQAFTSKLATGQLQTGSRTADVLKRSQDAIASEQEAAKLENTAPPVKPAAGPAVASTGGHAAPAEAITATASGASAQNTMDASGLALERLLAGQKPPMAGAQPSASLTTAAPSAQIGAQATPPAPPPPPAPPAASAGPNQAVIGGMDMTTLLQARQKAFEALYETLKAEVRANPRGTQTSYASFAGYAEASADLLDIYLRAQDPKHVIGPYEGPGPVDGAAPPAYVRPPMLQPGTPENAVYLESLLKQVKQAADPTLDFNPDLVSLGYTAYRTDSGTLYSKRPRGELAGNVVVYGNLRQMAYSGTGDPPAGELGQVLLAGGGLDWLAPAPGGTPGSITIVDRPKGVSHDYLSRPDAYQSSAYRNWLVGANGAAVQLGFGRPESLGDDVASGAFMLLKSIEAYAGDDAADIYIVDGGQGPSSADVSAASVFGDLTDLVNSLDAQHVYGKTYVAFDRTTAGTGTDAREWVQPTAENADMTGHFDTTTGEPLGNDFDTLMHEFDNGAVYRRALLRAAGGFGLFAPEPTEGEDGDAANFAPQGDGAVVHAEALMATMAEGDDTNGAPIKEAIERVREHMDPFIAEWTKVAEVAGNDDNPLYVSAREEIEKLLDRMQGIESSYSKALESGNHADKIQLRIEYDIRFESLKQSIEGLGKYMPNEKRPGFDTAFAAFKVAAASDMDTIKTLGSAEIKNAYSFQLASLWATLRECLGSASWTREAQALYERRNAFLLKVSAGEMSDVDKLQVEAAQLAELSRELLVLFQQKAAGGDAYEGVIAELGGAAAKSTALAEHLLIVQIDQQVADAINGDRLSRNGEIKNLKPSEEYQGLLEEQKFLKAIVYAREKGRDLGQDQDIRDLYTKNAVANIKTYIEKFQLTGLSNDTQTREALKQELNSYLNLRDVLRKKVVDLRTAEGHTLEREAFLTKVLDDMDVAAEAKFDAALKLTKPTSTASLAEVMRATYKEVVHPALDAANKQYNDVFKIKDAIADYTAAHNQAMSLMFSDMKEVVATRHLIDPPASRWANDGAVPDRPLDKDPIFKITEADRVRLDDDGKFRLSTASEDGALTSADKVNRQLQHSMLLLKRAKDLKGPEWAGHNATYKDRFDALRAAHTDQNPDPVTIQTAEAALKEAETAMAAWVSTTLNGQPDADKLYGTVTAADITFLFDAQRLSRNGGKNIYIAKEVGTKAYPLASDLERLSGLMDEFKAQAVSDLRAGDTVYGTAWATGSGAAYVGVVLGALMLPWLATLAPALGGYSNEGYESLPTDEQRKAYLGDAKSLMALTSPILSMVGSVSLSVLLTYLSGPAGMVTASHANDILKFQASPGLPGNFNGNELNFIVDAPVNHTFLALFSALAATAVGALGQYAIIDSTSNATFSDWQSQTTALLGMRTLASLMDVTGRIAPPSAALGFPGGLGRIGLARQLNATAIRPAQLADSVELIEKRKYTLPYSSAWQQFQRTAMPPLNRVVTPARTNLERTSLLDGGARGTIRAMARFTNNTVVSAAQAMHQYAVGGYGPKSVITYMIGQIGAMTNLLAIQGYGQKNRRMGYADNQKAESAQGLGDSFVVGTVDPIGDALILLGLNKNGAGNDKLPDTKRSAGVVQDMYAMRMLADTLTRGLMGQAYSDQLNSVKTNDLRGKLQGVADGNEGLIAQMALDKPVSDGESEATSYAALKARLEYVQKILEEKRGTATATEYLLAEVTRIVGNWVPIGSGDASARLQEVSAQVNKMLQTGFMEAFTTIALSTAQDTLAGAEESYFSQSFYLHILDVLSAGPTGQNAQLKTVADSLYQATEEAFGRQKTMFYVLLRNAQDMQGDIFINKLLQTAATNTHPNLGAALVEAANSDAFKTWATGIDAVFDTLGQNVEHARAVILEGLPPALKEGLSRFLPAPRYAELLDNMAKVGALQIPDRDLHGNQWVAQVFEAAQSAKWRGLVGVGGEQASIHELFSTLTTLSTVLDRAFKSGDSAQTAAAQSLALNVDAYLLGRLAEAKPVRFGSDADMGYTATIFRRVKELNATEAERAEIVVGVLKQALLADEFYLHGTNPPPPGTNPWENPGDGRSNTSYFSTALHVLRRDLLGNSSSTADRALFKAISTMAEAQFVTDFRLTKDATAGTVRMAERGLVGTAMLKVMAERVGTTPTDVTLQSVMDDLESKMPDLYASSHWRALLTVERGLLRTLMASDVSFYLYAPNTHADVNVPTIAHHEISSRNGYSGLYDSAFRHGLIGTEQSEVDILLGGQNTKPGTLFFNEEYGIDIESVEQAARYADQFASQGAVDADLSHMASQDLGHGLRVVYDKKTNPHFALIVSEQVKRMAATTVGAALLERWSNSAASTLWITPSPAMVSWVDGKPKFSAGSAFLGTPNRPGSPDYVPPMIAYSQAQGFFDAEGDGDPAKVLIHELQHAIDDLTWDPADGPKPVTEAEFEARAHATQEAFIEEVRGQKKLATLEKLERYGADSADPLRSGGAERRFRSLVEGEDMAARDESHLGGDHRQTLGADFHQAQRIAAERREKIRRGSHDPNGQRGTSRFWSATSIAQMSGNVGIKIGDGQYRQFAFGTNNLGIQIGNGGSQTVMLGTNNIHVHVGDAGNTPFAEDLSGYRAYEGMQVILGTRNLAVNHGLSNDLVFMGDESIPVFPTDNPFAGFANAREAIDALLTPGGVALSALREVPLFDDISAARQFVAATAAMDSYSSVDYATLLAYDSAWQRSSTGLFTDFSNFLNNEVARVMNLWGQQNVGEGFDTMTGTQKAMAAAEKYLTGNVAFGGRGADVMVTYGNNSLIFGDNLSAMADTTVASLFFILLQDFAASGVKARTFSFSLGDAPAQFLDKLAGLIGVAVSDITFGQLFQFGYDQQGGWTSVPGSGDIWKEMVRAMVKVVAPTVEAQVNNFLDAQVWSDELRGAADLGEGAIGDLLVNHGLLTPGEDKDEGTAGSAAQQLAAESGPPGTPPPEGDEEGGDGTFRFDEFDWGKIGDFNLSSLLSPFDTVINLFEQLKTTVLPASDSVSETFVKGLRQQGYLQGDGDLITSVANNNFVWAGQGRDVVGLMGANNNVWAGLGDDMVYATGDSNSLNGGDGNDEILVSGWRNQVTGGNGNDRAVVYGRMSFVLGNHGDDQLFVYGEQAVVDGGQGDDVVVGTGNFINLYGGEGRDTMALLGNHGTLESQEGDDIAQVFGNYNQVDTGVGDDVIEVHAFGSHATGGDGDDLIRVADVAKFCEVNGGAGDDVLSIGGYHVNALGGSGQDLFLVGLDAIDVVVADFDRFQDKIMLDQLDASDVFFERTGRTLNIHTLRYTNGEIEDAIRAFTAQEDVSIAEAQRFAAGMRDEQFGMVSVSNFFAADTGISANDGQVITRGGRAVAAGSGDAMGPFNYQALGDLGGLMQLMATAQSAGSSSSGFYANADEAARKALNDGWLVWTPGTTTANW